MKAILRQKNKLELGLEIIFFVLGFSIPFTYAFNSICIGVLFVYSFIWFDKKTYTSILKKPFLIPLLFIVFYSIQLIGIIYSDNLEMGFSNVKRSIVFLLVSIAFINLTKIIDYRKVKISVYGLIIGVAVILASAYINILIKIFTTDFGLNALVTHFVRVEFVQEALVEIHPPYFGLLVDFSLVPLLYINFSSNKILNAVIRYVLILFFLFSLYSISSFMSLLVLCMLLLVYMVFLVKKRKIKSLLVFTSIISLAIVFFINLEFKKAVNDFNGSSLFKRIEWSFMKGKGDTSRPENWKSVLLVVKENLLTGAGTDGGINQLQKHRSVSSESFRDKHNAHNQYLEVLLRHGIIGLIIYLLIIYQLIKSAIKSRSKLFCWFLLVFLFSSITESYLQRQIGLTFFVFYALMFNTFYKFDFYKNYKNEESIST